MVFLIDLTVDNHSKNHLFTLSTKEHTTMKTHAFPNVTKKGLCFGLTKALLAEGDASFPFAGHCQISLRRTLLLRKVMLAQRQRELQEEITSRTINMS